jgi:DNA ligase-1
MPNGTDFAIGTGFSDRERENPPAIGATVTFRYQELSDAGVPRFPSWVGIRLDGPATPMPARSPSAEGAHALGSASGGGGSPTRSKQISSITPAFKHSSPVTPTIPASPAAISSPGSSGGTKPRYFEFTDDSSNKFWEISQCGNALTTRWGRIGSSGQNKTKTFADEKAAANAVAKLIQQKTDEGYIERDK